MAQALHLANGTTINEKLRSDHSVVSRAIARKDDDGAIVERLFLSALCRRPTRAEEDQMTQGTPRFRCRASRDPKAAAAARRQAVEDLYWAVLTCQEFLFNH